MQTVPVKSRKPAAWLTDKLANRGGWTSGHPLHEHERSGAPLWHCPPPVSRKWPLSRLL
jgi:hypothetical protein